MSQTDEEKDWRALKRASLAIAGPLVVMALWCLLAPSIPVSKHDPALPFIGALLMGLLLLAGSALLWTTGNKVYRWLILLYVPIEYALMIVLAIGISCTVFHDCL